MPRLETPELVATIRRRTGQSQEDLARDLGVSFASVNAWERGRTEPRDLHRQQLDDIAERIGVRQGLTVLVIDDDPSARELAEAFVEVEVPDAEVILSASGADGLITLGSIKPDLVLLDVRMPGIDGIEVASAMTRVPGLERTVLVFVTSQDDPTTRARMERTSAADVVIKPLNREAIARCLALVEDEEAPRVEVVV
jgi:CheY-like chemotaxis protein